MPLKQVQKEVDDSAGKQGSQEELTARNPIPSERAHI